jgi:uncharacterized membrane protein
MVPSGSYFAAHFSPILLLILPFYAISPSATTLLIFGSFGLALGAVPLYLVASNVLKDKKAGMLFALLYLLYPPLQGANWFDFHTQRFLPLFLFSAYYFIQTKRWKLHLLSIFLALMVEEHVPILVFLMAVYFFIVANPRTIVMSLKCRRINQALISLIVMVVSVAWFFLAYYVKGSFYINPEFMIRYKATGTFSVLGVETDPLLFPVYILLNHQNVWSALMYDYPIKLFFITVLVGPLVFLPFRSKFSLVPLVLLVPSLLSNYLPYYTIGAQYPLYFVPLIFIASIIAVKKFHASARVPILKIALIVSMLFIVSLSPLSPLASTFTKRGLVWYPIVNFSSNKHIESLHTLLGLIPPESSVLTQNHIFPHVSARLHAYVVPPIGRFTNDTQYLMDLINKSDYILLDMWVRDPMTEIIFQEVTKNDSHGVYALGSKSFLFRKGYYGVPIFVPDIDYEVFLGYRDLWIQSGKTVKDELSKSGYAVLSQKDVDNGTFVSGPYICLPSGSFNVTFEIKVGRHSDGYLATFYAANTYNVVGLAKRDLYGFEMESDKWSNITMTFSSTRVMPDVEFQIFTTGAADVYLDRVIIAMASSTATRDFGTKTFNYKDLSLISGNVTEGKLLVHQKNVNGAGFFWWGPYLNMPSGKYKVSFLMKVSPVPSNITEKIITLDISKDCGLTVITGINVTLELVGASIDSEWYKIILEFITEKPIENVEFRGINPSSNYDIYLAYIFVERDIEDVVQSSR